MKLKKIKEAITISKRNADKHIIDTPKADGSLDLETINAGGVKEITHKKKKYKTFLKDKYSDFEELGYDEFVDDMDFTQQRIRGLIEYISYNLLRYLKRYSPEIRIPNQVRLGYNHDEGREPVFQTLSSSYKNTKQTGEMTKGNVYRNLLIDTFLFLMLIGHMDFHKGNLIVKNKDEYYMIDPELSLQDYEHSLEFAQRDMMEIYLEPYFKYMKSFNKLTEQYEKIMNIDINKELAPVIDKCLDLAVRAIIKDGQMNIHEIKKYKTFLFNDLKPKILYNIKKNKEYIKKRFYKYVSIENAVSGGPKPLRKT